MPTFIHVILEIGAAKRDYRRLDALTRENGVLLTPSRHRFQLRRSIYAPLFSSHLCVANEDHLRFDPADCDMSGGVLGEIVRSARILMKQAAAGIQRHTALRSSVSLGG